MPSRRTQEGHAWLYWDCRRQKADGYWFTILGNHEIDRAIQQLSSAAALKMYLYICKISNGRTSFSCPDGVAIGEAMIAEACGISRASMYRASKELRKAGLLQVSKMGNETRALLVSPQNSQDVDLRKNLNPEKMIKNSEKLQSHIQDCNVSQNCEPNNQLCQNSQSYICDDDQKQQDLSISPISPLTDQIEGEAENLNYAARSVERLTDAMRVVENAHEQSSNPDQAFKGVSDFLKTPNPEELALCSLLIKADAINEARENPHAFIHRVTRKTLKNAQCLLQLHGWYAPLRKRQIRTVLDEVLKTYFLDETDQLRIKSLIENRENGWTCEDKPAKGGNSKNAADVQTCTKPLADIFIDQYAADLDFWLGKPEISNCSTHMLFDAPENLPHAFGNYMRLIGELDDICDNKSEFRITPQQRQRIMDLKIRCGDRLMQLLDSRSL